MNDEFITKALEQDRYLKAVRLVDRFETEIERELTRIGNEFMRERPHLFTDEAEPETTVRSQSSSHIAYVRCRCEMDRVPEDGMTDNLRLELYLRWIDPDKFGHSGVDGALCAASYKIRRIGHENYQMIEQETREGGWDIHSAPDPHNRDPGTFYVPVETAEEIRSAFETLKRHFSEFGPEYGKDPN